MSAEAKHDDLIDDGELFARELEQRFGPPEPGDYAIELIANRGIKLTPSSRQRRQVPVVHGPLRRRPASRPRAAAFHRR